MKIRGRYEVVREPGRVPKLIWTPVTTLGHYASKALFISSMDAGLFENPQAKEKR